MFMLVDSAQHFELSLVQFPMQTQTKIKIKQSNIERVNFIFNQSQFQNGTYHPKRRCFWNFECADAFVLNTLR
jgi:hypothetical protein